MISSSNMGPREKTKSVKECFKPANEDDDGVYITVKIPETLRRKMKLYAVEHQKKLREVVQESLEHYLV